VNASHGPVKAARVSRQGEGSGHAGAVLEDARGHYMALCLQSRGWYQGTALAPGEEAPPPTAPVQVQDAMAFANVRRQPLSSWASITARLMGTTLRCGKRSGYVIWIATLTSPTINDKRRSGW